MAVVAILVRDWRIVPVQGKGESEEQAGNRLNALIQDCYFNLSGKIRRPDAASIKFVRRS